MTRTTFESRRRFEQFDQDELAAHQLKRLNLLFERILPTNRLYADKLAELRCPLRSLRDFYELPFTTKDELISGNGSMDFATNQSFPVDQYVRFHRTSGTKGGPLAVLDTAEDWQWWIDTWQYVLDAADVTGSDRAVMAFSFGPFIGFWSAYDALASRHVLVMPGGGMSTLARLDLIRTGEATLLCCTPSYALHLASVAAEHDIPIRDTHVRAIIVAGEPGGSVPAIRDRIERAWDARLVDHAGATEIGPWGYADAAGQGLHVIESEFLAEFISLKTGEAANDGELSELVLTTLGRFGSPVIRYRSGDLVRPDRGPRANRFVRLDGGVLGRVDDMMIIRGVNVFPSAIEQILREFPEVDEYRLIARKHGEMDGLTIEVEDRLDAPWRIAEQLRLRLGLNIEVLNVELGSLPRFELKGRRFVDERS